MFAKTAFQTNAVILANAGIQAKTGSVNANFDVCQKLVDYGADLDAVDKDGRSARSRLVSFGDERANKVLDGVKNDDVE